ncbi:MAG: hypothetical protein AAF997_24145 [Myxococcota bacterium]
MVRYLLVGMIVLSSVARPARAEPEPSEPTTEEERAERNRWTDFKIEALRREKRDLRIGISTTGLVVSILGMAAGSWMLGYGVEGSQPLDTRYAGDPSQDSDFYFARSATGVGGLVIGVSVLGIVRSAIAVRRDAKRRRQIKASIRDLQSQRR